jgi:hypothetical protein
MAFLPHFEDLYQQANTAFDANKSKQILEFLFKEEIDNDPRKLFLLIKRIDASRLSNGAVSVLSSLGAQNYPSFRKQYWDQFRVGSDVQDEPEDQPIAAQDSPKLAPEQPKKPTAQQPKAPPVPTGDAAKLEIKLFNAAISGDTNRVVKASDEFKLFDKALFAKAQKKTTIILLFMQSIKNNDTKSLLDNLNKLQRAGVPDLVIRNARRKALMKNP